MKTCTKCKQEKGLDCFRNNKHYAKDKEHLCIDCKKKLEANWREKNREKIRKKDREHYRKNSDRIKKQRKANYDPIKVRARWLVKKIEAEQCIFCDKIGQKHHPDYSHPLDIVFLCPSHHKQVHDGTIEI